jgi:tetratricopeptide (TPR) repeat protein/uncharacterized tellurite resistance protein B-like protein
MTNQEIYDELGQIGIIMISCIAMMEFDNDNDEKEVAVIVNIAHMLTNNDKAKANELIKKSIEAKNGLKTEHNIMEFVKAGAQIFKELDEKSKEIYLLCIKSVAEADGKVTAEEKSLYNLIYTIINGESGEDNTKQVKDEALVEDDEEEENSSEKGFPGIRIRVKKDADGNDNQELNTRVSQYLSKWQCPTEAYNGRMGIEGRIPSWIHKIDSDDCCPKFSDKEIEFINNKIVNEKIIPVLNFAPEEFYDETKHVWWIVPLSIWAGDKASWLFVDKNGIYAAHPGDEDIAMVFPWDRVDSLEYWDEDFDTDEPEVHSLNVVFDSGELTFVEFVSPGQGSYLSVIDNIFAIREETIEASKDASSWLEGAGGEGFKDFQKPTDLLDDNKWEDPSRPNPAAFGLVKDEEDEKDNKELDSEEAKTFIEEGNKKAGAKDYQGAIEAFNKAIELNPGSAVAYQKRGQVKCDLVDFQGAIEDFNKAILIDKDWWGFYLNRGSAKKSLKDYQGAIEDYDKVIEMNPASEEAYQNRAISKSNIKDYQGAIYDYNKVIEIDSSWWAYYLGRGNAKKSIEDFQGAIEDFTKVIELKPDYKTAYQNRGNAKSELKDYQGAIEDFTKAISIDENWWGYYWNRGNAKNSLKDFQGAIEDFTKVIELKSDYKWAYQNRGTAKSELKDFEGAINDFNKVIELEPDNRWNYWKRAEFKRELNEFKEAITDYDKAVEIDSNYDWAQYGRGLANVSLKDYKAAIGDFNKAIDINPNWWVLYKVRAEAKVSLKDFINAIDDFIKAIELHSYGSWVNVREDFLYVIEEIEKNSDFDLVTIKKETIIVELERAPLVELLKKLKIEVDNKETDSSDIINTDDKSEEENNISDSGPSSQNETENSITKSGNVILYNDFDTWMAEIRNGQKADSSQNIKERKPLEISKEAEAVAKKFFDELNLKCNEDDLLSFKFSPTGGCTVYFKNRKVAGLNIFKKNIIELMILRDYNKKYYRPLIENLNISNIREEQISHKVPWGYAFYRILNEPKLIEENFDTLFSFIQDGITTIKFDRILSLKAKEFRKLKPIFDGTFSVTQKKQEITENLSIKKKYKFVYKPTFIYLHWCDSLQDIENENFKFYAESDVNSSGTIEYQILEDDVSIFEYTIPVNHPEEEDLNLDELEGKILVREINVYSIQKINASIEEGASLQPTSVYYGLACNFDGVYFNFGDDEMEEEELQEYEPLDNETEERYFEYFLIKNGKPELLEI